VLVVLEDQTLAERHGDEAERLLNSDLYFRCRGPEGQPPRRRRPPSEGTVWEVSSVPELRAQTYQVRLPLLANLQTHSPNDLRCKSQKYGSAGCNDRRNNDNGTNLEKQIKFFEFASTTVEVG